MDGQWPQLFGFTRYLFTMSFTADLCRSGSSFVVIVVVVVILMDNTIPSPDGGNQIRTDFNQVFQHSGLSLGSESILLMDGVFRWLAV